MKLKLKDILIRLLYFIPFTIFLLTLIGERDNLSEYSSFNIKYLYVYLTPMIIFGYQTLRNSRLGWILVMVLYILFLVQWVCNLIGQLPVIDSKFTYGEYFSFWILVLIYLCAGYLYFKFRPKEKIV